MTKLYQRLSNKLTPRELNQVIGSSLYNGLTNFISSRSGVTKINYTDLLLKILGTEKYSNKKFIDLLINKYISNDEKKLILDKNNRSYESMDWFHLNSELHKLSYKKLGSSLAWIFDDEYTDTSPNDSEKEESHLFCQPFNQLPKAYLKKNTYLSLHDYQKTIKNQLSNGLISNPNFKGLVHMPTGSGKTKTSLEAVVDFLRTRQNNEGFVVWFTHTSELSNQAYQSFKELWQFKGDYGISIYKVYGQNVVNPKLFESKIGMIFLGFQKFYSILKSTKEVDINFRNFLAQNTNLTIIDEAHKSLANTYSKCIDFVSGLPNCRLLGLTATPGRTNDEDAQNSILSQKFDGNLIQIRDSLGNKVKDSISYLQKRNVLAEFEHVPIKFDASELLREELANISSERSIEGRSLTLLEESSHRNQIIIQQIQNSLADKDKDHILVFAMSASHCHILKNLLSIYNIESEVILGTTSLIKRDRVINDFKIGKLKVLINFGVLTTGFDAPKLKTVLIARQTNSLVLYSQMIGRAFRGELNGGNKKNTIIDLVTHIESINNPDFLFDYWTSFWSKKI